MKRKTDEEPEVIPRIFHYTCGNRIGQIIDSGEIRPSTATLAPGEAPLVWCSIDPVWERTSAKGVGAVDKVTGKAVLVRHLTMDEHRDYTEGLARIEVTADAAPFSFREAVQYARMPHALAKQMYDIAIRQGARPGDWRISATPILAKDWVCIEQFDFDARTWGPLGNIPPQSVFQPATMANAGNTGLGAIAVIPNPKGLIL